MLAETLQGSVSLRPAGKIVTPLKTILSALLVSVFQLQNSASKRKDNAVLHQKILPLGSTN